MSTTSADAQITISSGAVSQGSESPGSVSAADVLADRARPVANGPEIPGLLEAFWEYERALMADDLPALDALFAPGPDTLRGDAAGLLRGHDAISTFRGGRGGAPKRRIVEVEVRALGEDHAAVVAITELLRGGRGQQTQVWRRGEDGWKVAVAHVAVAPPAMDRRIWRVLGAPLVPASVPAGGGSADEAPGPLAGERIAVKDVIAVAGQRIGGGSPALLAGARPEPRHADAVELLLDAGAEITGIAATDELAYSLAGTNTHYGTPPNPRAPHRISGGSTSGPASAVSLGQASIGLGTDTGGSLRVPAAYQGLWALRPTHGAVPCDGVLPLAPSFDTVGLLTRTPDLLARAAAVLLPEEQEGLEDPALHTVPGLETLLDPEAADALDTALARWRTAIEIEEADPLDADELTGFAETFRLLQAREAWAAHGEWVSAHRSELAPDVGARFDAAAQVTADEAADAQHARTRAVGQIRRRLGEGVLVVPAASSIAPLVRDAAAGGPAIEAQRARTMRLTCLAGLVGLPAVAVPLVTASGLPTAVTLVGPPGSDLALIDLATRLEEDTAPPVGPAPGTAATTDAAPTIGAAPGRIPA